MNRSHRSTRSAEERAADERKFGFDRPPEEWIGRLREALTTPKLGHLGPYELLAEAGRGGQGIVYQTQQPMTGRRIALKRLRAGRLASVESRQRFLREIESTAALHHPHVVTIYGAELIDGQPVLTMEWIEGQPIDAWAAALPERKRFFRILEVFEKVCDAVHHAHQRQILHRDLKPSNVLVDATAEPHVLDFGLAKLLAEDCGEAGTETHAGDFLGTPCYAAPEQLLGAPVDIRADVYALGVLLFQLLTGTLPYGKHTRERSSLEAAASAPPPRATRRAPHLPGDIDWILQRALQQDPERRYPSVDAFAADLQRLREGSPIHARPPALLYTLRKLIRRNRLAATLTLLLLLALVTSAALSTWQTLRLRAQQEQLLLAQAGERAATRRAEDELARQRAVEDFVLGELLQAGLADAYAPDTTVADVLQRAEERLFELAEHPRLQADVRHMLGLVFLSLGHNERAEVHLRASLDARRTEPSTTPEEQWSSLYSLAVALENQGRAAEALPLLLEAGRTAFPDPPEGLHPRGRSLAALARCQHAIGDTTGCRDTLRRLESGSVDSWSRAAVLILRSKLAREEGRFDAAEADLQECLALQEREHASRQDANVAITLAELGSVACLRDRFQEAERHLEEAIAILRSVTHDRSPSLPLVMAELGKVYAFLGRPAAARQMLRDAVRVASEHRPSSEAVQAYLQADLAAALQEPAESGEAEDLLRRALSVLIRIEGELSPEVATIRINLAGVLRARGDDHLVEEAALLEAARAALTRAARPERGLVLAQLAEVRERQGDFEAAHQGFEAAIDELRQQPAAEFLLTRALLLYGRMQVNQGDADAGEVLLSECLERRRGLLPANSQHVLEAQRELGRALAALDDCDAAEQLLLEAYDVARAEPESLEARLLRQEIVRLYRFLEEDDRLREFLEEDS